MNISDYKKLYINEAEEILSALETGIIGLESGEDRATCIDELFRHAHNLKGISGAMGYNSVVEASHAVESVLDRLRRQEIDFSPGAADLLLHAADLLRKLVQRAVDEKEETEGEDFLQEISEALSKLHTASDGVVEKEQDEASGIVEDGTDTRGSCEMYRQKVASTRVDLERLDRLMALVGELVVSRIRLSSLAQNLGSKPILDELAISGRLISEIQREVMEARLVPSGQVFHRLKRLVRDVSREVGKDVRLDIEGSEIGLDRVVLEGMVDPLVHLIRNAIDHGIETPSERKAAGKDLEGRIALRVSRERNRVLIEVSDDGQGIDLQKVIDRGVSTGLTRADTVHLTEEELSGILATPGFSTSRKVDRYSGRGMGMNIVKKAADSFGGSMRIKSNPGRGTTVSLQLPINLSIIKALLFYVGEDVHALPIEYVKETARVELGSIKSIGGRDVFMTKGGAIPAVRPWEIFRLHPDGEEARYVKIIVVETGVGRVGLVVKKILGQKEIVIKGLPAMIRGIGGISGATILGSGRIAFIWDPHVLLQERCHYESNQEAVVLEN